MNKDKETMAREFADNHPYTTNGGAMYRLQLEAFIRGFDAGQAQLLEQASEGLKEWQVANLASNQSILIHDLTERAWQASALHSAKLLAEKDKEIERIKEELEWFKE